VLNEENKVHRVMAKFSPTPVSSILVGTLQKLVGRVVLPGNRAHYLYAPNSGKPCVYYRIKVEEERVHTETYTEEVGKEGHTRKVEKTREVRDWHEIIDHQHGVDFYLQDGQTKVFIPGGSRGDVQIESTWDSSGHGGGIFDGRPPPGVCALLGGLVDMQWMNNLEVMLTGNGRTGRLRYTECAFEVNELIAAIGVAAPATDPFTRQPVYALFPPQESMITEDMMDNMNWSKWDKRSWHDTQQLPHVVLSDKIEFTRGVPIQPIMDLPAYMLQPPQQFLPTMYQVPTAQPVSVVMLPMTTVVLLVVPVQQQMAR
jgi:hypothetical protein